MSILKILRDIVVGVLVVTIVVVLAPLFIVWGVGELTVAFFEEFKE